MYQAVRPTMLVLALVGGCECAAGCKSGSGGGGGGTGPSPISAVLQLSATPSPITPSICPASRCAGGGPTQLEVLTTLSLRETGGAAGRIDPVAVALRRNSDNTAIGAGTIASPSRFAASATTTIPLAMHFDQSLGGSPMTFTVTVSGTDDGGRAVTASLTVPVTAAPTVAGVLQIGGDYAIAQIAVETTCGDTGAPIPVTGVVTHWPGSADFVLRDTGGTTFNGTVQANGQFSAAAVFGPDGSGQTFTQRLDGRFTASGFTARLNVDVTPRNCRFTRDWTAAKQGQANVIP